MIPKTIKFMVKHFESNDETVFILTQNDEGRIIGDKRFELTDIEYTHIGVCEACKDYRWTSFGGNIHNMCNKHEQDLVWDCKKTGCSDWEGE